LDLKLQGEIVFTIETGEEKRKEVCKKKRKNVEAHDERKITQRRREKQN